MIRRSPLLDEFEKAQDRRRPNYMRSLQIVDGLLQEARMLGVFPPKNPLEGIELDIAFAQALRHVRSPS